MSEILSIDIRFICPECQSKLRVDVAAAGRRVPCTRCNRPVQVPSLPAEGFTDPRILSFQLRFACEECQEKNRIDTTAAGTWLPCAHCGKNIRVPPAPDWSCRMHAQPKVAAPAPVPPSAPARGTLLTAEEIEFLTRPDKQ